MSVSFYNERGSMNGIDVHELKKVFVPMQVMLVFSHAACTDKKAKNVSMDGAKAIRSGIDYYLVPHTIVGQGYLPLVPFTAISGSKAWMAVHSVKINDDNAASCVTGPVSSNVNCNDPLDHNLQNVVINLNSVVTQPTPGDYIGSMWGAGVDSALGWLGGKGAGKVAGKIKNKVAQSLLENLQKQALRRVPDADPVLDIPSKVTETVQEQVDAVLQ